MPSVQGVFDRYIELIVTSVRWGTLSKASYGNLRHSTSENQAYHRRIRQNQAESDIHSTRYNDVLVKVT
jgi:hypothetical protein